MRLVRLFGGWGFRHTIGVPELPDLVDPMSLSGKFRVCHGPRSFYRVPVHMYCPTSRDCEVTFQDEWVSKLSTKKYPLSSQVLYGPNIHTDIQKSQVTKRVNSSGCRLHTRYKTLNKKVHLVHETP